MRESNIPQIAQAPLLTGGKLRPVQDVHNCSRIRYPTAMLLMCWVAPMFLVSATGCRDTPPTLPSFVSDNMLKGFHEEPVVHLLEPGL